MVFTVYTVLFLAEFLKVNCFVIPGLFAVLVPFFSFEIEVVIMLLH